METTFVIKQSELNSNFLASLKKLFKNEPQLQITITIPEDFNLLQTETAEAYISRLEQCMNDVNTGNNTIAFTETQLEELIFEKL